MIQSKLYMWGISLKKLNIKYINIPSVLVFDKNIPALAKIIYGQIQVLSHKLGVCKVTNSYFAECNNCSQRTIGRMLKILYENGYIKIDDGVYRKITIP